MTSTGVPQASSRCLGAMAVLLGLRFGLRLVRSLRLRVALGGRLRWSAAAVQQPLLESVCENGLVQDIHMASLIQYVESGHVQL